MNLDFEELRTAFGEQSRVFVDLVDQTADLSIPTLLDGWNCAVLVGHVSTAVEALWRWQGDPPSDVPEIDAVSWWDGLAPEINDDFAQRYAAKRSDDQLRVLVDSAVRQANEMLSTVEPDTTLVAPGGVGWARYDQVLAARIVEVTVHGFDLAAATGSETEMSPAALAITGLILDERLDGARPTDLGDDARWVPAATGRAAHLDPRLPVMT